MNTTTTRKGRQTETVTRVDTGDGTYVERIVRTYDGEETEVIYWSVDENGGHTYATKREFEQALEPQMVTISNGGYHDDVAKSQLSFTISPDDSHPAGISLTMEKQNECYVLTWTDFVINDWTETYDNLSTALARMAVLARCAEHNWEIGFTNDTKQFMYTSETFLNGEAQ
jgi:hypothetical protein